MAVSSTELFRHLGKLAAAGGPAAPALLGAVLQVRNARCAGQRRHAADHAPRGGPAAGGRERGGGGGGLARHDCGKRLRGCLPRFPAARPAPPAHFFFRFATSSLSTPTSSSAKSASDAARMAAWGGGGGGHQSRSRLTLQLATVDSRTFARGGAASAGGATAGAGAPRCGAHAGQAGNRGTTMQRSTA